MRVFYSFLTPCFKQASCQLRNNQRESGFQTDMNESGEIDNIN